MKTQSLLTLIVTFLLTANLYSNQILLSDFDCFNVLHKASISPLSSSGLICVSSNRRGVNFDGFMAVKLNDGTIQLFWETIYELDNDYFVVQRSFDGVNFEEIEFVDAKGNSSNTRNDYMVSDQNFKTNGSLVYYRVKQVDFNGNFSYSDLKAVKLSNENKPIKRINLEGQEVNENYEGIVIEIYTDGINRRFYQTKL